jgi:hypothetical protein
VLGRLFSIPILLLCLLCVVSCSPPENLVDPTTKIDPIEQQFAELLGCSPVNGSAFSPILPVWTGSTGPSPTV